MRSLYGWTFCPMYDIVCQRDNQIDCNVTYVDMFCLWSNMNLAFGSHNFILVFNFLFTLILACSINNVYSVTIFYDNALEFKFSCEYQTYNLLYGHYQTILFCLNLPLSISIQCRKYICWYALDSFCTNHMHKSEVATKKIISIGIAAVSSILVSFSFRLLRDIFRL